LDIELWLTAIWQKSMGWKTVHWIRLLKGILKNPWWFYVSVDRIGISKLEITDCDNQFQQYRFKKKPCLYFWPYQITNSNMQFIYCSNWNNITFLFIIHVSVTASVKPDMWLVAVSFAMILPNCRCYAPIRNCSWYLLPKCRDSVPFQCHYKERSSDSLVDIKLYRGKRSIRSDILVEKMYLNI